MSTLSPDNQKFINQLLARGEFASESDAINEAIGLLRRREKLRDDVNAGINQADGGQLVSGDEVFDRLTMRADEIEASADENA